MNTQNIVGIDLGATHARAGLVSGAGISAMQMKKVNAAGSPAELIRELFDMVDLYAGEKFTAIGIGVPGLVDQEKGLVHDLLNIPAWEVTPLQQIMEERYQVPVKVNNDSNCFALGEFYFGKGRGQDSLVGLTIGTGLGAGIILDKKLYAGRHGAAGEFGMIPYLDKFYEYYASGQFFRHVHGQDGEIVFEKAKSGDADALRMYEELGMHLGNAIKTILYALDTGLLVLGGSVSRAFDFFAGSMRRQLQDFAFKQTLDELRIEVSELEQGGILGAAALHYGSLR